MSSNLIYVLYFFFPTKINTKISDNFYIAILLHRSIVYFIRMKFSLILMARGQWISLINQKLFIVRNVLITYRLL